GGDQVMIHQAVRSTEVTLEADLGTRGHVLRIGHSGRHAGGMRIGLGVWSEPSLRRAMAGLAGHAVHLLFLRGPHYVTRRALLVGDGIADPKDFGHPFGARLFKDFGGLAVLVLNRPDRILRGENPADLLHRRRGASMAVGAGAPPRSDVLGLLRPTRIR